MGLTDQVGQRVLFTNCNDLPKVMNERTGFYCVRGNDLDRLEPKDFEVIRAWLKGTHITRRKKSVLPHQTEALDDILASLVNSGRATAVMPCGSGKTLVGLWASENMECQNIIVLVPSLALIRQTLHEWVNESQWKNAIYICVCSDPTVVKGSDSMVVRQSDLDFTVSTDSEMVKGFLLHKFDGVKIVFSTYQSAHVVAQGMRKDNPFDFGLFDEAHKTAGREGTKFSFALKDENLPIRKRLFMTATPRHYDIRKKDKEGDSKLVYSMDVPETYGHVAHKMSFAEAVRQEIICEYKIVISVITSEMVTDELLRRGEVIVDGDPVKARQVANQIAIQKAVEKYSVRKIFTFHRTVASAKSFTHSGAEGISSHLPNFAIYHVNGAMPTVKREERMMAFREVDRAVMSNARCLTEGVDVPAVDMVAFLAPKRSRIDIVQATGRAMRKEGGKTAGYILLPLFLEQATGESVEEAIERTEFDEVFYVLQAMQEQDSVLADIIHQMREERGRTGGYDDSRFREKIAFLGPELTLDILTKSIVTKCIEKLGNTWDEHYGELRAFWEKYGHSNVPSLWEKNITLSRWVVNQRVLRNKGLLSRDRIKKLETLSFIWDMRAASWEEMFFALVEFKKQHGHCNVPQKYDEKPKLGLWANTQRTVKKNGKLSEDRVRRLDELGFIWAPKKAFWEEMFAALQDFTEVHGHCNVGRGYRENPKLPVWVNNQRRAKRNGELSDDQISRLSEIGFVWELIDTMWEEKFLELLEFKAIHGHCRVPNRYAENPELANWVGVQRAFRSKGTLSEERFKRLDEIGFIWDVFEDLWEEMFSELVKFKEVHGHCDVPDRWPENQKLAKWVKHRRSFYKTGRLNPEQIKALDGIGFVWNKRDAAWEEMFSELMKFREIHGHFSVPRGWPENPRLATWVERQRAARRQNEMIEKRIYRLDEIGFVWDTFEDSWEEMFSELVKFKEVHGHTNVPAICSENPKLGRWVNTQRTVRKKGKLSHDRVRRLDEIGFQFEIKR